MPERPDHLRVLTVDDERAGDPRRVALPSSVSGSAIAALKLLRVRDEQSLRVGWEATPWRAVSGAAWQAVNDLGMAV